MFNKPLGPFAVLYEQRKPSTKKAKYRTRAQVMRVNPEVNLTAHGALKSNSERAAR